MKRVHPLWGPERHQAYTEVALVVCAKGEEERLTEREIIQRLGSDAIEYARQLPHGPDETFQDTFMEDLNRDGIITYDHPTMQYGLGLIGNQLVINFLEEWAGAP